MFIKIIFFTSLFLICTKLTSATFYFSSTSGIDLRTSELAQNPDTPWQSIQKLNLILKTVQGGDSILFKSGDTFHGTVIIAKSGSVKSSIYFGKYSFGEKPVLTGLKEISIWVPKGDHIYESSIPENTSSLNIVGVDNILYAMGRYPNSTSINGGYLTIKDCSPDYIGVKDLTLLPDFTGGEIVIRKNNWVIDRHIINSQSEDKINFTNLKNNNPPTLGYGFFIQNHASTLDSHGEWYYDKKNKKLLIYYVGNPANGKVEVSTLNEIITIQSMASNLYFENLTIKGSNQNLITIKGSSNLTFENCNLELIGQNAINTVSSRDLTVSNSQIKNSLNGGVFLGWNDQGFTLKNSTFENIFNFPGMGKNGEMQGQAIYMSEASSNVLLESNKFLKCGYNAINFSGNNIEIKNNLIDTFCFIKDDGAAIYTFTGPAKTTFTNRKVIGNIIINGIGATPGTKPFGPNDLPYVEGIYLDTFVNGIEIDGNTIANIKSKGIFLNNANNISVTNNKIVNTGYSIYIKSENATVSSNNIVVENNDFLSITPTQYHFYIRTFFNEISQIGKFDNNIFSNPLNKSKTFFLETPSLNEPIDFETWKAQYGFDKNSSMGPSGEIKIHPSDINSLKLNLTLIFDYNSSNLPKIIPIVGTYIDLKGNKKIGEIEIPPYSSVILLKSKN